jgi:hypothetical protein
MDKQESMATKSFSAAEIKTEEIPGLDLSYELLKDTLSKQYAESHSLDNKAISIFTISAAIIGLGLVIPLGTSFLPIKDFLCSVFGWLSLGCFITTSVSAVTALWCREYITLDNPQIIREEYWELPSHKFKIEMLLHIEDYHPQNQHNLMIKGKAIMLMVPAAALQAIFLVLLFVFR